MNEPSRIALRPPNRLIDEEIARKVFGCAPVWECVGLYPECGILSCNCPGWPHSMLQPKPGQLGGKVQAIPGYSTVMTDAWLVVNYLISKVDERAAVDLRHDKLWVCSVWWRDSKLISGYRKGSVKDMPTAARAVCGAVLAAYSYKE